MSIVAARIPAFLRPKTIDTLPLERPVYYKPGYLLMRESTGELYIDGEAPVKEKHLHPKIVLGRVGIMRASHVADNGDVESALVADIRCVKSVEELGEASCAEPPEDEDEREAWTELRKYERPIAAFVYIDETTQNTPHPVGDSRFTAAALQLAELTNHLYDKTHSRKRKK